MELLSVGEVDKLISLNFELIDVHPSSPEYNKESRKKVMEEIDRLLDIRLEMMHYHEKVGTYKTSRGSKIPFQKPNCSDC